MYMQTLPWKKIFIVIFAIGVVIAGVFYLNTGTAEKPAQAFVNPAFGEYISTFTSGVVSSGSPIRVMLSQDAVDSTEIGNESINFDCLKEYIKIQTLNSRT